MRAYMTPFLLLLQMKFLIMLEVRKYTLLLMDFQVTIRSELLQRIDIRQHLLQKWDPFSTQLCLLD